MLMVGLSAATNKEGARESECRTFGNIYVFPNL